MGPRKTSSFRSQDYFYRLSEALEFAVSEWLLMFLLFVDACFGYLIARFASYCRLQGPCLLCSRFDHVLAKDKTGIHLDLICNHHKSEISSLVLTGSIDSDASEFLLANGGHDKNEKNIFVDESLELFRSSHVGKNRIVLEYQKVNADSDSEPELLVSDNGSARGLVPEVHLKPRSRFEVRDPATVATRDSGELKWRNDANKQETAQMSERISIDKVPSSDVADTPVDAVLETFDPPTTGEVIKNPTTDSEPVTTTNGHQVSNHLDLGDAYKLAISTKGRQLSGKLLDQKSFQDSSTRVTEDLKLLLSHRSNDNLISPKPSFNSDELAGMQFLQSRISLERNESSLSLDGSIVSEIDGESAVDRLKRQVDHDKKLLGILYKELEEERNASAVATNQAMAMITRLQEEKASLYTEALQYLRMMEEQAEYNNEALQKANDLVEEKEKQIQDLEEMLRKISEDVTE